jgi:hypothetical protein
MNGSSNCPSCGVRLPRGEVQAGRCASCGSALGAAYAEEGVAARQPMPRRPPPPRQEQDYDRPRPGATRGGSAVFPFFAFLIALAAFAFVVCYDPFQTGLGLRVPFVSPLSRYEVDKPAGAYMARDRINVRRDVLAMIELQKKTTPGYKQRKEKLTTLAVDHEAEFKSKGPEGKEMVYKILFVTFDRDKQKVKEVVGMHWMEDAGIYVNRQLPRGEIEQANPQLAREIESWGREAEGE